MTGNRREWSHGDIQSRRLISITDAALKSRASAVVLLDAFPARLFGDPEMSAPDSLHPSVTTTETALAFVTTSTLWPTLVIPRAPLI